MAKKLLHERIHDTPPCRSCQAADGLWAVNARGEPILGRRCWCRRGHMLAIADARRAALAA